jgi:hypothetical protein
VRFVLGPALAFAVGCIAGADRVPSWRDPPFCPTGRDACARTAAETGEETLIPVEGGVTAGALDAGASGE